MRGKVSSGVGACCWACLTMAALYRLRDFELAYLAIQTIAELRYTARDLVKVDRLTLAATFEDVHRHGGGDCELSNHGALGVGTSFGAG